MKRLLAVSALVGAAVMLGLVAKEVLGVSQGQPVPPVELRQGPSWDGESLRERKKHQRKRELGSATDVGGAAPVPASPPIPAGDLDDEDREGADEEDD